MHRMFVFHLITLAASFMLLSAVLPALTLAASPSQKTSARPAAPQTPGIAAGAVEDSLQACLARIPKDATAGQRLIAEQSCQRDEGDRQPVQATGGR